MMKRKNVTEQHAARANCDMMEAFRFGIGRFVKENDTLASKAHVRATNTSHEFLCRVGDRSVFYFLSFPIKSAYTNQYA